MAGYSLELLDEGDANGWNTNKKASSTGCQLRRKNQLGQCSTKDSCCWLFMQEDARRDVSREGNNESKMLECRPRFAG